MRKAFLTAAALGAAMTSPAQAGPLTIRSAVFVERMDGGERTVETARSFRKGERVVTVMRWDAPRGGSTVTSAVPAGLQFETASADRIEISTDGGRNWTAPGAVQPAEVTHLRWRVGQGTGRLTYSAIVR